MWLPNNIVEDVNRVARVYYVDVRMTTRWNRSKDPDELRLLTGWCWSAKSGGQFQQGLKTVTMAYRDAWYVLVAKRPSERPQPLRLVRSA